MNNKNKNEFYPLEIEVEIPEDNNNESGLSENKDTTVNESKEQSVPIQPTTPTITLHSKDSNTPKNPHQRRFGNVYLFWYDKRNQPRIVIGPHWHFFIIGFVTFLITDIVFYYYMWKNTNTILDIGGLIICFIHLSLYLLSFLKNPGINLNKPRKLNSNIPTCEYCGCISIKDKKQKHCDICDACFIGYDHHCPWTSKCVAEGNKRVFYSFLMFCLIAFIYPVIVISSYNY